MRPYKPEDVPKAIEITGEFPNVHGAPVYHGHNWNEKLGIISLKFGAMRLAR